MRSDWFLYNNNAKGPPNIELTVFLRVCVCWLPQKYFKRLLQNLTPTSPTIEALWQAKSASLGPLWEETGCSKKRILGAWFGQLFFSRFKNVLPSRKKSWCGSKSESYAIPAPMGATIWLNISFWSIRNPPGVGKSHHSALRWSQSAIKIRTVKKRMTF